MTTTDDNIRNTIRELIKEEIGQLSVIEYKPVTDTYTIKTKDTGKVLFTGDDDDTRLFIRHHGVSPNDIVVSILRKADDNYNQAVNLKRIPKDADVSTINTTIGALRKIDDDSKPVYYKTIYITDPESKKIINLTKKEKSIEPEKEEPIDSTLQSTGKLIDSELASQLVYNAQIRNLLAYILDIKGYKELSREDQQAKMINVLQKETKDHILELLKDATFKNYHVETAAKQLRKIFATENKHVRKIMIENFVFDCGLLIF